MFFVTIHINDLPCCYGTLKTRGSLPYFIFIVLEEQELILLGHDIFVAISVGIWDSHMPECWSLKSF